MKVVINKCYGGFSLSKEACELYANLKGIALGKYNESYNYYDGLAEVIIARNDPTLVYVVERLGEKANGSYAKLRIVEIPDDVKWVINEYDGNEWIAETHRTWG